MPRKPSVRYNAEIEGPGEEPYTMNYITEAAAIRLVQSMRPGDALVFNAVEGPGEGEI